MVRLSVLIDNLRQHSRLFTSLVLGLLLIALTGVTVTDVVGRYVFSAPLPGGTELTELLVMAVVFAGLPGICLDDGHVTVDIFTAMLRGRGARLQLLMARLFVAGMLLLAGWQLWRHGLRLAASGLTTVYLHLSLAPVAWMAALLCWAGALMSLATALGRARHG